MKPYGQRGKLLQNLEDNHPQKGYENWWESECDSVEKKRERQIGKKKIREELAEYGAVW